MKDLKQYLKEIAAIILVFFISIAVYLLLFIFISWIEGLLFIPEDFTIWGVREPYDKTTFISYCLIFFGLIYWYFKKRERKTGKESLLFQMTIKFSKSTKIIGVILIIVMLCLYFTNTMCIKDERIILLSTFYPSGKEYSLKDVKRVEAGFSSHKKFFGASKGEFYYIITLKDGKKFDINNFISEGKKYENDTYSSIEEIDKKIMESNPEVVKTSSLDYYEYSVLDQQYKARFQIIIENKR